MKHFARRLCAVALCLGLWSAGPLGQSRGVDDALLLKPLADNWPTYSGDYTGRRFSSLAQINRNTVKNLTLSWVARLNGTVNGTPGGAGQTILGGVGTGEYTNINVKGFV